MFYPLIALGCLILGLVSYKTLSEQNQTQSNQEKGNKTQPPKQKNTQPAMLCLIIPVSQLGNLKENSSIGVYETKKLIDSAIYFLCTMIQDANDNEPRLELLNEKDISSASENTEVYVKIEIDDGKKIIDQKIPYILKTNLPINGKYKVKKLACLKYLSNSGLEKFNRV